jgi:transposase
MRLVTALLLREGDRESLTQLAAHPETASGLVRRARMILLASEGMPNAQIARVVGVSRPTVIFWRERYERGGIPALEDEPRPGRPQRVGEVDILVTTLARGGRPPARLGIPHWSARFLAAELDVSFATVARVWRRWDIQPQLLGQFSFATRPALGLAVREVVGLYLSPPDNAVVVTLDQPLAATGQVITGPRAAGPAAVYSLMAALESAAGPAPAEPASGQPFLHFLQTVAASCADVPLHVVLDDRAVLPLPVTRWLAGPENERISFHLAGWDSWLTLAAVFFGLASGDAAPGDVFRSGRSITDGITAFIAGYESRRQAFTWPD